MMQKKNPYKYFEKFVLRTPLLSFSNYKKVTASKKISDDSLKKIANDPIVKEALFLASPSLSQEITKWLNGEIDDKKKEEKLKYSILKYFSRMSSRSTPFGLFAGCAVGNINTITNIKLKGAAENMRHTRLDMNYLVALSQDLVKDPNIRNQLKFFPNTSIYVAGNQLRYVEYKYVNSKRQHHIVAVDHTDYLDKLLELAKKGALLSDLAKTLVDDEISIEEATEFITELVSSQLLISELEPAVSGPEFLDQIFSVLNRIKGVDHISTLLKNVENSITSIDANIGNNPDDYLKLSEQLKRLKTDFELKFMFQTDMVLNTNTNTLSENLVADINKGMALLNRLTFVQSTTNLSSFKDAFHERYEEREVPLSKALDVEIGIGYKQNQGSGDVNPLVDNLVIQGKQNKQSSSDIKWNSLYSILQKKLIKALNNKAYIITIKDEDFSEFDEDWSNLPDTMSFMVELIKLKGEEKIRFSGGGGSSAANLLGRFCHGDPKLYTFTKEIIEVEKEINDDKILAEIVHLPESRVGNILMRPELRDYEIPYLAKSLKDEKHQLPIDDLMVSIKNNKHVFLRSRKHNKEVIPHLTNAHNYSSNSLPIYNFLADMQTQNLRSGLGFGFGPFASEFEFVPRVEYKNLIILDATWNLKKEHIEKLINSNNDSELDKEISILKKEFNIPDFVMLADGDNELLINFNNLTSVKMFLDTVKKRPSFKLTEFLFSEDGSVKDKDGYFSNQLILSYYNQHKLNSKKQHV